ncbi:MAG: DrmE family protein, partial [Candidatus Sulfotelmatobacter sp.]
IGPEQVDLCDELSARLAVAAMVDHFPILIAFPDFQAHRAAILFASVLLRFWWNNRQQNLPKTVLYLGSHIGIRDQLDAVKVANLSVDLGTIFEETHLSRHDVASVGTDRTNSALPRVVTVYSPANVGAVLTSCPPDLIAIDIGARSEGQWFNEAVDYAKARRLPLVAWGENPLSRTFQEFSSRGEVFTWPPQRRSEVLDDPAVLLDTCVRPVTPIMPIGEDADRHSDLLREATKLLASTRVEGRLAEHALATHWQYLRILETLPVPVEIYEAEAPRYWGVRSIADVQKACERFQQSCWESTPALASALQAASTLLDDALARLKATEPPLWRLLATVCVEGPPEGSFRHITFTSRARRDLFAYSLLARFNVSDDDLLAINVGLNVPDELWCDLNRRDSPRLISTTIGVPSPAVAAKILPALLHDVLEFVIYRHQMPSLRRRLSDYGHRMSAPSISEKGASPTRQKAHVEWIGFSYLPPATVDLGKGQIKDIVAMPKWIEASPETEATGLFDDLGRDDVIESSDDAAARPTRHDEESESTDFVCETALRVEFDDDSWILFPPDAGAHVITRKDGRQVAEERFVRALRAGDQIVFIQGQQRQNLYDLLIHRVHSHPAFQIHLVLVRRWQDDFISAFGRSTRIRSVQDLLDELRLRGSSLVSTLTLRNWLGRSTLCPDDEEDLHRLGEIFNLHFVVQHYKRIAKAAARIRGLHRGLAIRLNHWLEEGAAIARESDVIDNELGLKFSDFASSLVILRVRNVS